MYARIWWHVMMKNIWFLQLKPRVAFEHGMMELCIIWAIFFMFAYITFAFKHTEKLNDWKYFDKIKWFFLKLVMMLFDKNRWYRLI